MHINRLIDEGRVARTGATRNTRYVLPGQLPQPKLYRGEFATAGLDENRVYQRLALSLNLAHAFRSNAEVVFHYVLDRFRFVELDFRNVDSVGQGFADEVFRVFAQGHPQIDLRPVHASPAVNTMIRHARAKA